MTRLKISRRKIQKLKMWQNSYCEKNNLRTQIMTKLKYSVCDKTQRTKLWQNFKNIKSQFNKKKLLRDLLVRTFWHLNHRWNVLWAAFCNSCNVFLCLGNNLRQFLLLILHLLFMSGSMFNTFEEECPAG